MNNALLEKECEPMPLSDRTAVINALRIIAEPGQVVELRALDAVTDKILRPQTVFGFFDNAEKLADAVGTIKSARGVYLTLNPVAPALLVRRRIRFARRSGARQQATPTFSGEDGFPSTSTPCDRPESHRQALSTRLHSNRRSRLATT